MTTKRDNEQVNDLDFYEQTFTNKNSLKNVRGTLKKTNDTLKKNVSSNALIDRIVSEEKEEQPNQLQQLQRNSSVPGLPTATAGSVHHRFEDKKLVKSSTKPMLFKNGGFYKCLDEYSKQKDVTLP